MVLCVASGTQISWKFKCHRHLNFFSFLFHPRRRSSRLIKMLFLTNKSLLIISCEKGEENHNFIYDPRSFYANDDWPTISLHANEKKLSIH